MIASYLFMRILFFFFLTDFANNISLLVMILSTILTVILLFKYKTRKFKTQARMRSLKKIVEDEKDVPRRIVRE